MSHVDDQRAQIDTARAHESTFSAQHALAEFVGEFVVLSSPESVMYLADVEVRELTGGTSRRAASAPDAFPIGGNLLEQAVRHAQVSLA